VVVMVVAAGIALPAKALATVVYFCSGGFADRHTSNVVVDRGQRRKRKKLFCVGIRLGPWTRKSGLVLVHDTGLFVPLLICAILWRGKDYLVSRRLLLFYLPFTLCFVIPNAVKTRALDLGQCQSAFFIGGWHRAAGRALLPVCGVVDQLNERSQCLSLRA